MVEYTDQLNVHEIELGELVNTKVTHVDRIRSRFGEINYLIHFSDGKILTASDGETGDDAFCFMDSVPTNAREVKRL
jgi:hypothetical protein